MNKPFSIVVAHDLSKGIGIDNQLPWHFPSDMAYFKSLTEKASIGKRNAVIMGRKTWESIPEQYRPLTGRFNIILSKNTTYTIPETTCLASSLNNALSYCDETIERIFVIGGSKLYYEAIKHPYCEKLYITLIHKNYNCDAFFPNYEEVFTKKQLLNKRTEKNTDLDFLELKKA